MPLMRPVRINESEFEIRVLDIPGTEVDPDFREPVGGNKKRGTIVTVTGQVARGTEQFFKMQPSQTGNANPSTLHAVFRPRDLESKGLADPYFKPGDLVVSVAMNGDKRTLNFVITSCRKGSPLKSVGRWLLVHIDASQDVDKLGSL